MERRNTLANLRRLLTSAGIPRKDDRGSVVDIHALRHTCGTRHARGRSPLQNTQKLLGHSDPKLTASTYSHIEGDDLRADVEGLPSFEPVVRIETHVKAVGAEGSSPSGRKLARAISEQEPAKDAAALTASPAESNGWGQRRELNPQPLLYESSALPLSYSGVELKAPAARRLDDGRQVFFSAGRITIEASPARRLGFFASLV